jgi:diguanylate cyclase (GGDEF)-like protein
VKPKFPAHLYTIAVLDEQAERSESLLTILRDAGFRPDFYTSLDDLLSDLSSHPPHMVLVRYGLNRIETLRERLPETHFLAMAAASDLAAAWRNWGDWIEDCLLTPPIHPHEFVKAVGRAADFDALVYRVEELEALKIPSPPAEVTEPLSDRAEIIEKLEMDASHAVAVVQAAIVAPDLSPAPTQLIQPRFSFTEVAQTQTLDEWLSQAVGRLSVAAGGRPSLFLRYLPHRNCLVASFTHGVAAEAWPSLGIDLGEEVRFNLHDLRYPEAVPAIHELAEALSGSTDLWARTLFLRERIYGIFLVCAPTDRNPVDDLFVWVTERAELLDSRERLHAVDKQDPRTGLMNRVHFLSLVEKEIARARRICLPVSLLMLKLDQFNRILAEQGLDEADLAIMSLGKIISPRIRANDFVGRLAHDVVGLLLPHTARSNAGVKAEKVRRLVGAADFSQLLPRTPELTISVGVTEYPSCARDVEDMLKAAEDALWQVRESGNVVCLAREPSGWLPDFASRNMG